MSYTFKGGYHIKDCKNATNSSHTVKLPDCEEHIFMMQQHIGAPLTPLVKVGDQVKVGQKIADSDAFLSVPVHSSVSGTVTAIRPRLHPSGEKLSAVYVQNDMQYTVDPSVKPVENYMDMEAEELLKIIREKGLVGMGGAGFPTFVKLNPKNKIDYLILNGAECEPYITSDHRRMLEYPAEIIKGIKIAMKVLGLNKAYIGIEENKLDAVKLLRNTIGTDNTIEVRVLKAKYPQGAEKQLINAITKRRVPSGKLPAEIGVVVMNIDTAYDLWNAFENGMPVVRRIVTVSGDCVNSPANFDAPTGVPIEFMFQQAGGFSADPKKVIIGGPMMGIAQYNLKPPTIKTTSSILALTNIDDIFSSETPCIRCGKCVERCPMRLMPVNLNKFALNKNYDMADKYNILDCMECGLCSFICPSKRNLLHNIRIAKQAVASIKRSQTK